MAKMSRQGINDKSIKEFHEAILEDKRRGASDAEIGQKYGVNFKYIEKLITKTQGINVSSLKANKKIKALCPQKFKEERTTVWSFKHRGDWATHTGEYRGNWSPYIPRNVILKYSEPGDIVLDYFCGAGTTAIEAKLLGRRCIALDINDKSVELAKKNLDFKVEGQQLDFINSLGQFYEPQVFVGDARNLSFLYDNSIDLICTHPPYANIIRYTDSKEGDLSFLDTEDFLKEMSKVAIESFRVLKPGRQCAILIGDARRKRHILPLGFRLINVFLNAGFRLKELIIKRQHNCKTTGFWYANSLKYNFLLLAHEYLPIFEKPELPTKIDEREKLDDRSFVPILEKSVSIESPDKLETTSVWIFHRENFDEQLNKNVISRYSDGSNYSVITIASKLKDGAILSDRNARNNKRLLFIKSADLDFGLSRSETQLYLRVINDVVSKELHSLIDGGFLVVQTRDIRIDGYIEPLGKLIMDMMKFDNLWLKEIIVVTREERDRSFDMSQKHLEISHGYLLVYEKIK